MHDQDVTHEYRHDEKHSPGPPLHPVVENIQGSDVFARVPTFDLVWFLEAALLASYHHTPACLEGIAIILLAALSNSCLIVLLP